MIWCSEVIHYYCPRSVPPLTVDLVLDAVAPVEALVFLPPLGAKAQRLAPEYGRLVVFVYVRGGKIRRELSRYEQPGAVAYEEEEADSRSASLRVRRQHSSASAVEDATARQAHRAVLGLNGRVQGRVAPGH